MLKVKIARSRSQDVNCMRIIPKEPTLERKPVLLGETVTPLRKSNFDLKFVNHLMGFNGLRVHPITPHRVTEHWQ